LRKKNLIVFDIDDTLTKSERQHQSAYVNAMRHFGMSQINQDWKCYRNVTDSYILKVVYEQNFQKSFPLEMILDFEERMTSEMLTMQETEAILGANSAVQYFLNETDYAICFATGSLHRPAMLKLEQAKINFTPELVEASNTIYTREDIVRSAMLKAKDYFQVDEFDQIISVGDGIWDMKTAKNLGVHFLGIRDKNLEDFQKEGIKSHITDWMDFDFEQIKTELGIN
jgi:phosphoglycolate phosphatase-like HAD superfamily hydrolase